jgi:N-hydroxyarylamine O-acetyltransferase
MDIAALCHRIHYSGTLRVDEQTLCALHRAFVMSAPFENLDIHLGRRIVLDERMFFQKIVERGRGGFCYELNGLFAAALRQLGFDVQLLSAKVFDPNGQMGREFAHLLLLVQLEDAWIADVGFGDWFTEPIRFERMKEQVFDGVSYRIVFENDRYEVQTPREAGEWKARYSFTRAARQLLDFAPMCDELQIDCDSYFRRHRICTRPTEKGRVTLTGEKLIVTSNGERSERVHRSEEDFAHALKLHFGISLYR